jgi:hypothetical protein
MKATTNAPKTTATRTDLKEIEKVLARVHGLQKAIAALADHNTDADEAQDLANRLEECLDDMATTVEIELDEMECQRLHAGRR